MAGIDYTIPGQFRGIQIESPTNVLAQGMQLRNLQESSEMNALKRQEYQQLQQEQNALAKLYGDRSLDFGSDEFLRRAADVAPRSFEGVATRAAQRENLLAQKESRQAETAKREFELKTQQANQARENFQTAVGELINYNTVTEVVDDINKKEAAGEITPQQAAALRSKLPKDDAGLDSWRIATMRGLLPPIDRLADVRAAKKDVRDEQRLTNEEARLKLEGDRIAEQTRHANAMEENARKGADRAEADLKEKIRHNEAMERLRRAEINKPTASENPNKVASTVTDDQGNVTFFNAFGQVIRTETRAGKSSPTLIKQELYEKNLVRDIERATKELDDITKDGGLIDQSTGSGFGRAVDVSNRFFGNATEGDIASGKLKPIADMVLKMVPRFEGPQSDKDTQLYKEAAGQLADSSLPTKLRKESGKTILRLMKERKNQFAGEGMDASPAQRAAPQSPVRSQANAILGIP